MTEREIQARIQLAIGSRSDARVFRVNVGVARDPRTGQVLRFGVPGMADLLVLTSSGQFLWLEVKSPTGRLSKDQIRFRDFIHRFAGERHYAVARSVEEAEAAVARLIEDPC